MCRVVETHIPGHTGDGRTGDNTLKILVPDQVASSMIQTEWTMNELQFITGLNKAEEKVPSPLCRETVPARE